MRVGFELLRNGWGWFVSTSFSPTTSLPRICRASGTTCNVLVVHFLFYFTQHASWIPSTIVDGMAIFSTFLVTLQIAEIKTSRAPLKRYLLCKSGHDPTYFYLAAVINLTAVSNPDHMSCSSCCSLSAQISSCDVNSPRFLHSITISCFWAFTSACRENYLLASRWIYTILELKSDLLAAFV